MDKRMSWLLLYAYISVLGFVGVAAAYFVTDLIHLAALGTFFLLGFFLFVILGLSFVYSVISVVETIQKKPILDGRFFNRMLIYRALMYICLSFCIIHVVLRITQIQAMLAAAPNAEYHDVGLDILV